MVNETISRVFVVLMVMGMTEVVVVVMVVVVVVVLHSVCRVKWCEV